MLPWVIYIRSLNLDIRHVLGKDNVIEMCHEEFENLVDDEEELDFLRLLLQLLKEMVKEHSLH